MVWRCQARKVSICLGEHFLDGETAPDGMCQTRYAPQASWMHCVVLALREHLLRPGIFLSPEQWEAVAGAADNIDAAINALGGGVAGSSCNPISQNVLMLGWTPCS